MVNLWFVIIGVLFTGFIFLEGFDFGVGVLLPFVAKNDSERQVAIGTIGPLWDGNEVWLLTAGGAMFAAFPYWYATLFSGFYLALFVVLAALIVRGVTFEFRNKSDNRFWRENWDTSLSISSALCALLFPVALANLLHGTPLALVDQKIEFVGRFWDLLNPFSLFAGLTLFVFMLYHGAIYLAYKGSDLVEERSRKLAKPLGFAALILLCLLTVFAAFTIELRSVLPGLLTAVAIVFLAFSMIVLSKGKDRLSFLLNFGVVACIMGALFSGLFPYAMISSIDMSYSLLLTDAASSAYTLKIMSIIALTLLPIVLLYQYWTFKIFRARVTLGDLHY